MDVFALSSLREGVPVAMLEAMAKGIPVIATNVGGIPEVINNGLNGILVPVKKPALMADEMIAVAGDKEKRTRIGNAGRRVIEKHYSVSSVCKQYESLISKHWKK
jgi:glycosyltransferase involved in cell wall biosynthesis